MLRDRPSSVNTLGVTSVIRACVYGKKCGLHLDLIRRLFRAGEVAQRSRALAAPIERGPAPILSTHVVTYNHL